jgi:hypothetical protein
LFVRAVVAALPDSHSGTFAAPAAGFCTGTKAQSWMLTVIGMTQGA